MSVCVYPSDSSAAAQAFPPKGMQDRHMPPYPPRNPPPYSLAEPSSSSTLPPLRLAISQVSLGAVGRPAALEPPSGPSNTSGPWLPSSSSAASSATGPRPLLTHDAQYSHRPREYDIIQANQIRWNPDQAPRRPSSASPNYIAAPVSGPPHPASPSSTSPHGVVGAGPTASSGSPTGSWSYPPSVNTAQSQPSCHLHIRQQPEVARACGFGERDRRVIDPPPILELDLGGRDLAHNDEEDFESQAPVYIVHASLWNEEGTEDVTTFVQPTKKSARRLVGTLVSSGTVAQDENRRTGCFFTFADLSCRTNGRYRLRFNLVKIDPRNMRPGSVAPILASILSDVWTVYSPKDFPGMRRSTPLTQALKDQGVSVPAKKSKLNGTRARSNSEED